jgi:hypothetical protein
MLNFCLSEIHRRVKEGKIKNFLWLIIGFTMEDLSSQLLRIQKASYVEQLTVM